MGGARSDSFCLLETTGSIWATCALGAFTERQDSIAILSFARLWPLLKISSCLDAENKMAALRTVCCAAAWSSRHRWSVQFHSDSAGQSKHSQSLVLYIVTGLYRGRNGMTMPIVANYDFRTMYDFRTIRGHGLDFQGMTHIDSNAHECTASVWSWTSIKVMINP